MDTLTSMRAFVRVVERGGFAPAARELSLSPAMVGRHVQRLEERLGATLLMRSTRRQSLTAVGRAYYERCVQILAEVEAADGIVSSLRANPRGLLRVNAPTTFGARALSAEIADYVTAYPEVSVELTLNDRVVDLVDEGFEAAVRIGALEDSSLIARRLRDYEMALCASPAYLKRHGTPETPDDLRQHNCLGYIHWSRRNIWPFSGPSGETEIQVNGNLQINNGEALRTAALNGLGIILQPRLLLEQDTTTGRLVEILSDWHPPKLPMHIILPPQRPWTPKIRTFIDYIVGRFPFVQQG